MDGRDARILASLMADSRTSIGTIAEAIGVSVAATYKRILQMEEGGVIRRYRCLVRPSLLGGGALELSGRCEGFVSRASFDRLGEHPAVFQITVGSHNHVYVTAVARSTIEVNEVRQAAERILGLREPRLRSYRLDPVDHGELTALDCAIVHALSDNARLPLTELARYVDASERDLSRALARLVSSGLLIFTLDLATKGVGGHWIQLELQTNGTEAPDAVLRATTSPSDVLLCTSHFAESSQVHAWVWTPSTASLESLHERIQARRAVVSVVPGILIASYGYPIWIRDELARRAGALRKSMRRRA